MNKRILKHVLLNDIKHEETIKNIKDLSEIGVYMHIEKETNSVRLLDSL